MRIGGFKMSTTFHPKPGVLFIWSGLSMDGWDLSMDGPLIVQSSEVIVSFGAFLKVFKILGL